MGQPPNIKQQIDNNMITPDVAAMIVKNYVLPMFES